MYMITARSTLSLETMAVPIGLFAAFTVAHIVIRFPQQTPPFSHCVCVLGNWHHGHFRLAPNLAVNQRFGSLSLVVVMIVVLAVIRNLDALARYKYPLVFFGKYTASCQLLLARTAMRKALISFGAFTFQPGEIARFSLRLSSWRFI